MIPEEKIEILEQGCRISSCTRISTEVFRTRSIFLGTREECSVWIDCDVHTFRVLDGGWEIQRTFDGAGCASGNMDDFRGTEAYFEAGMAIRNLPVPDSVKEMLRECVRSIIQAETYLIAERGYASPGDYDAAFARLYERQCRFYTYPDQASPPWSEFVGGYQRMEGLFHRYKAYIASRRTDGLVRFRGTFCDSFHEMNLEWTVSSESGLIQRASAQFLRAPGPPCFYCSRHADALPGKPVTLSKRELGTLLGGAEGCSHLVDLAGEMFTAAGRIVTVS